MAIETKQTPLEIKHGHTTEQVTIIFSQPVGNLFLTPAQADDFMKAIQMSMDALAAHQAKKA